MIKTILAQTVTTFVIVALVIDPGDWATLVAGFIIFLLLFVFWGVVGLVRVAGRVDDDDI